MTLSDFQASGFYPDASSLGGVTKKITNFLWKISVKNTWIIYQLAIYPTICYIFPKLLIAG